MCRCLSKLSPLRAVIVFLGLWLFGGAAAAEPAGKQVTLYSKPYEVKGIYRSMKGPWSQIELNLAGESKEPELCWVTGYKAVMVESDSDRPMPQEFMCHSNLDLEDSQARSRKLGLNYTMSRRLFTLSQGQLEIQFPEGFGIPISSDDTLKLTTQVLNLNHHGDPVKVRHKVTLTYVRDSQTEKPMKPLFGAHAFGLALVDGEHGYYGVDKPDPEQHGPGCMVGSQASNDEFVDSGGRKFTGHWVVPEGRSENRTLVTRLMALPYSTTVHYIAVHLHPYAESLTLRDLTTGEVVFRSKARNFEDKIGLEEVEYYTSVEGIELHPDHQYEMVSVYNNTSGKEQDSMAVMYMYLFDKEFKRNPEAAANRKL